MDMHLRHSLAKLAWLELVSPELTGPTKRLAERVIKKTIRNEVTDINTVNDNVQVQAVEPPVLYPTNSNELSSEAPTSFDQKIASYYERYR